MLNRISLNNEIKMSVRVLFLGPRRVRNSLCKVNKILFHKILFRDGVNQNEGGIIKIPIIILVQFIEVFQFVEGSKDANRFAIIFN